MNLRFYIYWFAAIFFISCAPKNNNINSPQQLIATSDTIKYAHGFSIHTVGKIKILRVFNPWEGAKGIEYKYILCHKDQQVPDSLKKWPIIPIPVKRIVCLSTTHIAVLSFLNRMNTLVGVSGPQYISDTLALKMISLGKVADVGYDQALNYEVIVSLHPDIVLAYGIQNETATQYKKLEELGIRVVLNGEYLENTPLGKLEWVKYMATFFDASAEADQKFHAIEQEYQTLTHLCDNIKTKPSVMTGLPWKGAWYVPGGESYLTKMIQDAGGKYLWNDFPQRESIGSHDIVVGKGI
jgi:iron complex transport system substrate-binding protein